MSILSKKDDCNSQQCQAVKLNVFFLTMCENSRLYCSDCKCSKCLIQEDVNFYTLLKLCADVLHQLTLYFDYRPTLPFINV